MRLAVGVLVVVGGCSITEDGASTFGPASSYGSVTAGPGDTGEDTDGDEDTGDGTGGTAAAGEGSEDATTGEGEGGADDAADTVGPAACGDGVIDAGEACDGTDVGGDTCEAHGYAGGMLACAVDCTSVDLAGCTMDGGATCGNGTIDAGEQCDGANLDGMTCAGLGFDMGVVSCTATCTFDGSGCSDAACAEQLQECSLVPCCADLFCYPFDPPYCGPTP